LQAFHLLSAVRQRQLIQGRDVPVRMGFQEIEAGIRFLNLPIYEAWQRRALYEMDEAFVEGMRAEVADDIERTKESGSG
jgi:hypothetical protein